MNNEETKIYEALCGLLPTQIDEVILRADAPTHHIRSLPAATASDLIMWMRQSPINHEKLIQALNRTQQVDATPLVPALPQPYFVHPYPLQANFTGRDVERRMLTDWLANGKQPIFALVAIGGMGKSSLAWYWLQHDINVYGLDGTIWWSFYEGESSFSSFLDNAINYFSSKGVQPSSFTSNYHKARELVTLLQQHQHRVLLVLDGFERQLRIFGGLDAAYQCDEEVEETNDERACIDPIAAVFLRDLVAGTRHVKVLLTTRLMVHDLEDNAGEPLEGCLKEELDGLQNDDAVTFMREQGVSIGRRDEIIAVCNLYGNHPLSLRLLSGFIKKDHLKPGDISVAPKYSVRVYTDLKARKHHILEVSYNVLSDSQRLLLSRIAAFRSPIAYGTLSMFNELSSDSQFDDDLNELIERGLVLRDIQLNRYDLHPIVRRYAYDRLSDKVGIHTRLLDYFAAIPLPQPAKAKSLDDLAPVIELYHHTFSAGIYDKAIELYVDRLNLPLYELGAYQIIIDFLKPLLSRGEESDRERAFVRILLPLAKAYRSSGNAEMAVMHLESEIKIRKAQGEFRLAAITLGHLADVKMVLGNLSGVGHDLHEGIKFFKELGEDGKEKGLHRKLGILLTYEGKCQEAEIEMKHLPVRIRKGRRGDIVLSEDLSFYAFLKKEYKDALNHATYMLKLALKFNRESDVIVAEWLSGVAQLQEGERDLSQQHLHEAILRCRRVNLLELEPDILLAWARWHHLWGDVQQARNYAKEALRIADRHKYRLKQADLNNFLAHIALESSDPETARKHAQAAYELAWCDGPSHTYKLALEDATKLLESC